MALTEERDLIAFVMNMAVVHSGIVKTRLLLFLRKELFETTKDSLGVTFVGGMCHPQTSCSMVEANSFKAVQVAAHELAHSMGVPHDGEGAAARCPGEGFIMGQSLSEETFAWSNCSRDAISAFLR